MAKLLFTNPTLGLFADARTRSSRAHVRACADAVTIKGAACSDGPDMSARSHSSIADTCASGHY